MIGGTDQERVPAGGIGATSPSVGFGGLLAAALSIRLCLLALDRTPRFFLSDSEAYLETAIGHWIPADRSWSYGIVVNVLIRLTRSFTSVLVLQTVASAALAAGIASLCSGAGVRRWIAWGTLIVLSLEPMSLYYDRAIMTDGPGAAAVVAGIVLAACWIMTERRPLLVGAAACLWAAIWLRTALLPMVFWVPVFLVSWTAVRARPAVRGASTSRRGSLLWAAAFLVATAGGAATYGVATGIVTGSRPSLNPRGGYFLLGVVAPILAPQDFAGIGVADPAGLLAQTRHGDRSLRNWQVFGREGLALRLEEALRDWRAVSRAGSILARRSIARDPLGFASLAAAEGRDYLRVASYRAVFRTAFGLDRPLTEAAVASLRKKIDGPVDPALPWRPSPLLTVLRAIPWWPAVLCWLGLVAPLLAIVVSRRGTTLHGVVALLASSTWLYLLSVFALSPEVVPRYVLPVAPLGAALVACTVERLLRRGANSSTGGRLAA